MSSGNRTAIFFVRHRLLQELHSLGRERAVRRDEDARHVATRLRKALDESDRDGIEVTVKDDRDGRRRFLGRACRAARDDEDEIDALRDELAGERREPVDLVVREPLDQTQILALDVTFLAQRPRKEGRQEFVILVARSRPQDANAVDATGSLRRRLTRCRKDGRCHARDEAPAIDHGSAVQNTMVTKWAV